MDADGWAVGVQRRPTNNFDARPPGAMIELLVLHNISLPPGRFGTGCIEQLFCNELDCQVHPFLVHLTGLCVSSHFLIARDGQITQFVSCADRAWHAGASSFGGRVGCNDFSVGIEIEGTDFTAFEPPQYVALAGLTSALRAALPLRAVRGHSHIAGGRKTDPGPMFEWARFAREARLPTSWLPDA